MKRPTLALALIVLVTSCAAAADWPQFRGPERDGISPETGLLKAWPSGGPKPVMKATGLGEGYASVAVVGDRLYTAGGLAGKATVFALDTEGKVLWKKAVGDTGGGGYGGPRSTPTVVGDHLVYLTDLGELACLKTSDGEIVWSKNILREYGAGNITWKLAESPLVDGDRVICAPGGKAALAAFDLKTGKELWTTPPVDAKTGYASAIIVDVGGKRQVVSASSDHIFGADAATGKLLWKQAQSNKYHVIAATPLYYKTVLFSSCGYGWGSQALKLSPAGGARQVWTSKDLDDHFGGVILLGTKVFGTASRGGLVRINLANGQTEEVNRQVPKASNIFADGRLYCQGHDGTVLLVDPASMKVTGKMAIQPAKKNQLWAHPAIAGGRLYIRNGDTLTAYRIKGR